MPAYGIKSTARPLLSEVTSQQVDLRLVTKCLKINIHENYCHLKMCACIFFLSFMKNVDVVCATACTVVHTCENVSFIMCLTALYTEGPTSKCCVGLPSNILA